MLFLFRFVLFLCFCLLPLSVVMAGGVGWLGTTTSADHSLFLADWCMIGTGGDAKPVVWSLEYGAVMAFCTSGVITSRIGRGMQLALDLLPVRSSPLRGPGMGLT